MKKYMIYIQNQPIQVSRTVYQTYWKSVEQEKYQDKKMRKGISLDTHPSDYPHSLSEIQFLRGSDPTKEIVDSILMREWIQEALHHLPNKERELIELLFFHQMTEVEVADQWQVQHSAINKRKKRILKKLHSAWEQWYASQ